MKGCGSPIWERYGLAEKTNRLMEELAGGRWKNQETWGIDTESTTSDHMLNVFPLFPAFSPGCPVFWFLEGIKRKKGKKQEKNPRFHWRGCFTIWSSGLQWLVEKSPARWFIYVYLITGLNKKTSFLVVQDHDWQVDVQLPSAARRVGSEILEKPLGFCRVNHLRPCWWFGTFFFNDFPYIGNFIIPTDKLIFTYFSEGLKPPTRDCWICLPFIPSRVKLLRYQQTTTTGLWFGTFGLFFHILRIIIPTDELIRTHIFQRGR